jgi:hypothetical protein
VRQSLSIIIAACLVLQPALLLGQTATTPDTRLYLADGTVVMGTLLERGDDLIIVRGGDGEIHTFEPAQISKLVTLESLGSQARTVEVREFPYISFLGGTVALALISWLQFDTASDRDAEAEINEQNGLIPRAQDLQDKADRARLWGWSAGVLAAGSLGVALIPKKKTKKVFPELSLDSAGEPRVSLVYRHTF